MTTETPTTTEQPASAGPFYVPSTSEFSLMDSTQRAAAMDRMRTERAAYEAQTAWAVAATTYTPSTPQELALDQQERDIHGALSQLGKAHATYERELKALTRGDGTPVYSEAEHAERVAALQGTLASVLEAAQTTIGGAISAQQALITHLDSADPLDALSPGEAAAANARLAFIKEDAERLPADALLARCRMALSSGDKATQYLLARYVAQRVENLAKELREGLPVEKADMTTDQRMALLEVVKELRSAVRGPQAAVTKEAAYIALSAAKEARAKTVAVYDAVYTPKDRTEAALRATGRYSL